MTSQLAHQLPSFQELSATAWFEHLPQHVKNAVKTTLELSKMFATSTDLWDDYSFVLFPLSRAYEGFLKEFFLHSNLITHEQFYSKRFRIGRSFNPDISLRQRDQWWIYDDVAHSCGQENARMMWDVWIACRNQVFHYFPDQPNTFTLSETNKKILMLLTAFEVVYSCRIE